MIYFFGDCYGDYYGGLVVKNLKKVFYVICGVALVFVGIIIGGLIENDADAQTEPNPEYKVIEEVIPTSEASVQEAINEGCQGGYIFHQMVVTNWDNYDMADDALLIFKKK